MGNPEHILDHGRYAWATSLIEHNPGNIAKTADEADEREHPPITHGSSPVQTNRTNATRNVGRAQVMCNSIRERLTFNGALCAGGDSNSHALAGATTSR